jgi:hypothetical protein
MTRALDGWNDLDSLLEHWPQLSHAQQPAILRTCGQLARQLHAASSGAWLFLP